MTRNRYYIEKIKTLYGLRYAVKDVGGKIAHYTLDKIVHVGIFDTTASGLQKARIVMKELNMALQKTA